MRGARYVCAVLACLAAARASANPSDPRAAGVPFMRVFASVQAPYGFVRFCDMSPGQCRAASRSESRFSASPERLSELDDINRSVNRAIQPETDLDLYGVSEYWTLPRDKGDCEDYALLKRALLMKRGWPSSSLLLTVVRDEKGEGHAVLTARTAQGDYILDNKADEVRLWHATPYTFVMRQSSIDPRVWVSLDPIAPDVRSAIAGVSPGGRGPTDLTRP